MSSHTPPGCWFITPKRRDSNQQFQGTIRLMVGLTSRISMNMCFYIQEVQRPNLCHLVVENPLNMDHPKDQPLCLVCKLPGVCINMLRAHRNPNDLYFLKANPRKTRPFPKGSFGFQVFSRTNVKWENFDFMVQNGWLGQFSRFKVVFFFPEMFWYRNVSVFLKGRVGFQVYLGGGFKYYFMFIPT